jgi:hypothetical protein
MSSGVPNLAGKDLTDVSLLPVVYYFLPHTHIISVHPSPSDLIGEKLGLEYGLNLFFFSIYSLKYMLINYEHH